MSEASFLVLAAFVVSLVIAIDSNNNSDIIGSCDEKNLVVVKNISVYGLRAPPGKRVEVSFKFYSRGMNEVDDIKAQESLEKSYLLCFLK